MRADLNLTHLHRTARALTAFAVPTHTHPLHLQVAGDRFTITALGVELAAQITLPADLPSSVGDGAAVVPGEALLSALAAVAPAGRDRSARVDVRAEGARLRLAGPAASVALPTLPDPPAAMPLHEWLTPVAVADTTVAAWRQVLAAVLPVAAGATDGWMRVVRMHRQAGACLLVEATDARRIHRVRVGDPDPLRVDVRLTACGLAPAVKVLALDDPAAVLHVSTHGEYQVWTTPTTTIAVRGSEQRMPDLERFFEQHTPTLTLRVDAPAVALACTRAAAVAARNQPMVLAVVPAASSLTLTVADDPNLPPKLSLTLPASQVHGSAATLRLHPGYAKDLFTAAGPGTVQVGLPTEDKVPIGVRGDRFTGLLGTYPSTQPAAPGGAG